MRHRHAADHCHATSNTGMGSAKRLSAIGPSGEASPPNPGAVVQLARHQDRAGLGGIAQARRHLHRGAEQVAALDHRLAGMQADPHMHGIVGPRVEVRERTLDLARTVERGGRVVTIEKIGMCASRGGEIARAMARLFAHLPCLPDRAGASSDDIPSTKGEARIATMRAGIDQGG
jgi:hypothetical protein